MKRASHCKLLRCPQDAYCRELRLLNFLGLGTAVAFIHFKAHPVPSPERLESGHINRRVMNKYVSTVIPLDEAIPLLITEPFYDPFTQITDLLSELSIMVLSLRSPLQQKKRSFRAEPTHQCTRGIIPYHSKN